MKRISMPAEPPIDLSKDPVPMDHPRYGEMDEVLFDLCRRDDYEGLYREFVKRFSVAHDDYVTDHYTRFILALEAKTDDNYAEVVNDLKRELGNAEERIARLRQLEALVLTDHRDGRTRWRDVVRWSPLELGPWSEWSEPRDAVLSELGPWETGPFVPLYTNIEDHDE